MKESKTINPTLAIPTYWETWKSVKNAPFNIDRLCPHVWNGVFMYGDENDFYGFLNRKSIITPPIFTTHAKMLSKEYGLIRVVSAFAEGPNNWTLLNLKTGEILLKNYAASCMLNSTMLAYRVDSPKMDWPNNMFWGVIEIPSGRQLMNPTLCPFIDFDENYVPTEKRILSKMAELKKVV